MFQSLGTFALQQKVPVIFLVLACLSTCIRAVPTGWISVTFDTEICREIHNFVTIRGKKNQTLLHVLLMMVTLNHLESALSE